MQTPLSTAISVGTGVGCAVAAILIWTVGGKHTPRFVLGLVLTAAMGLASTRLGNWISTGLGWGLGWLNTATSWVAGASIVGLIGFVACYIVLHDTGLGQRIWSLINRGGSGGGGAAGGRGGGGFIGKMLGPHQVRNRTLAFTASLPFTAIALPGGVGTAIAWLLGLWGTAIAWIFASLFGIH